jgi:hypothetical protein
MSAIAFDPLIAEAQRRARRRHLLLLLLVVAMVAAVAVGTRHGLRSTVGNSRGVCATVPSPWRQRTVRLGNVGPTVVLTNWRFGHIRDFYGLVEHRPWPASGVTVAVTNDGAALPRLGAGALRVRRGSFRGFEGMVSPGAQVLVNSHGRLLNARIEVGAITPATLAAANQALAGVRTCSA